MTKRLVFNGKSFAFVETADAAPPPVGQQPRLPQKAAYGHRGLPHRLRNMRMVSTAGNGYRPGQLLDLGLDQCRFTIHGKTMCGAKCVSGNSWCEEHARVVSRGKFAFDSYRMQTLGGRK